MADNENTANAAPTPADGRKRFKSEVAFPYAVRYRGNDFYHAEIMRHRKIDFHAALLKKSA